jgi:hypothetical protein
MREFRWSTLHFITRLIVIAAFLHLAADALVAVRDAEKVSLGASTWLDWIAATGHAFGYSLIFFGSAATVELLFRIWREFREMRAQGVSVSNRAAPPSPPTSAA